MKTCPLSIKKRKFLSSLPRLKVLAFRWLKPLVMGFLLLPPIIQVSVKSLEQPEFWLKQEMFRRWLALLKKFYQTTTSDRILSKGDTKELETFRGLKQRAKHSMCLIVYSVQNLLG